MVGLLLAEFAARWQIEGSFGEALGSVFGTRSDSLPGRDAGVVFDTELGFKLDPRLPGVNSRGIRHAELPVPKPAGEFRAFLVGDSVGFPLDGFFALAGNRLRSQSSRDLEFVNACVHGYTTYQERRFLERDLLDLQPELVVLQYCVNDNHRFLHRLTSSGRRLLTLEAQNHLFPAGDGLWPWLTRSSYLVYSIRKLQLGRSQAQRRVWEGVDRAAWSDATWPEQAEHVRAIATQLQARGATLMVLAVPHEDQLDAERLADDAEFVCRPQRRLAEICTSLGVPFLDMHAAMFAHRDQGLYYDRLHLTAAGHQLVAQHLAEFLLSNALVPR